MFKKIKITFGYVVTETNKKIVEYQFTK